MALSALGFVDKRGFTNWTPISGEEILWLMDVCEIRYQQQVTIEPNGKYMGKISRYTNGSWSLTIATPSKDHRHKFGSVIGVISPK